MKATRLREKDMNDKIFQPADILLPGVSDMRRWSVVACDQFTAEPEYWQAVDAMVGDAPSALRLILPEAWLERPEGVRAEERIRAAMQSYLDGGLFRTLPRAFVYTERTQPDGQIRRGLVGALDLEAYDFRSGSTAPVRATEGTVESRLPPRVRVRALAPLEMPHVMVLADDPDRSIIEPLAELAASLEKLYDFELMMGGGRIVGRLVAGEALRRTEAALSRLAEPEVLAGKYGAPGENPLLFAMGDGNHSLAAAKLWWEELKATLSEKERETHPARFGLVELVNIHDEAIDFEPIHRVLFDTDAAAFPGAAAAFWEALRGVEGVGSHTVTAAAGGSRRRYCVEGLTIGQLIAAADEFCAAYIKGHGGRVDYVHGGDTAGRLAAQPGCCAILLPAMDKSELFPSVIRSGAFPRKSFSIGTARDKRYYLECRRIR